MSSKDYVTVRPYYAPNWVTTRGVYEKRKRIENKGLPSFTRWRFITLTLDQSDTRFLDSNNNPCPLKSYLIGKEKMRRFLYELRKLLGYSFKWCWKLEFQKNGWAHWHLLVDKQEKLSYDDLLTINEIWGLGRTNVKMVRPTNEFLYTFKYAFKPASEGEDCVPAWFANYGSKELVKISYVISDKEKTEFVIKPVSFARIRFFQTSRRFYTGIEHIKTRPKTPPLSCIIPYKLCRVMEMSSRKVQIIAYKGGLHYAKSAVVMLNKTLDCYQNEFINLTLDGSAAPIGVSQYMLHKNKLKNKTCSNHIINKIAMENRLQPRQAFRHQKLRPILHPF